MSKITDWPIYQPNGGHTDPDELYLMWLGNQVGLHHHHDYWELFKILYKTKFTWTIANDDNRAEDGVLLRQRFVREINVDPTVAWMSLPCSVLEMLIALCERLTFEGGENPYRWFCILLRHLRLHDFEDHVFAKNPERVQVATQGIIDRLLDREYEDDGVGGLFPLEHPYEDQRKVEIWYQMNAYLLERE